MQELIDKYPDLVTWYRPLFSKSRCWQVGVMQGINEADRKDPSIWKVVTRRGKSSHSLAVSTNVPTFKKQDEAHGHAQKLWADKASTFTLLSPLALNVNSLESPFVPASSSQSQWCIQPVIKGVSVFVWVDGQTNYVQMCEHGGTVFIDLYTEEMQKMRKFIEALLFKSPDTFVCGILDDETLWVYDVLKFPDNRNLVDRLNHFFGLLESNARDYWGNSVSLAPFQVAFNQKEVKEHSDIFIQCGHYDQVIIR